MITDILQNSHLYEKMNARIAKGFDFLKKSDLNNLAPGKYEIDGDDVFASINEYETKDFNDGKYEAHKKYIDIQYIVKGEERLYYAPISKTSQLTSYNIEKDIEFLNASGNFVVASVGTFVVFFPTDAHMPNISSNTKGVVKKVVVKVLAD
jgi:YhcH/YjgK/YiaL family protein